MRVAFTFVLSTVVALASTSNAQTVHQLPATPSTVAYGYQAASMAGDLHITELVDGNVGVHMMIAKSYLR